MNLMVRGNKSIGERLRIGWQSAATMAFAVAAYGFWNFIRPELVSAREAFLLFLWNGDYFLGRLSEPGGFARYVGEFLVQFFKSVSVGALICALLLSAVQWLSWILLKRSLPALGAKVLFPLSFLPAMILWFLLCDIDVTMTLPMAVLLTLLLMLLLPERRLSALIVSLIMMPVGYWLLGPVVLLLALWHLCWLRVRCSRLAVVVGSVALALLLTASVLVSSRFVPYSVGDLAKGIDYVMIEPGQFGTSEEIFYDYLQRQKAWDTIISLSNEQEPKSLACKNITLLARYYNKQVSADELKLSLLYPNKVLTSGAAAMMMSDLYLHMGFVNMSQRAAFEVMESPSNYNKSARELVRLVETNLIIGQHEVAQKYISLLEETLFYCQSARRLKTYVLHPEQIKSSPFYGSLQEIYGETSDVFFF